MTVKNVVLNFFKRGYSTVMLDKLMARLREPGKMNKQKARAWYSANAIDMEVLAEHLNKPLFEESKAWNVTLSESARKALDALEVKLGGGGNCVMLYYLVRKIQPSIVVETGVAAGFSSKTILTALELNGRGTLYSSDFPYFRLDNPEQYVGILVEEKLRKNWKLYINGDESNLPEIVTSIGEQQVDLFHYDSDKSYSGRVRALKIMKPCLTENSLIVFDDIVDNSHFMDLVLQNNWSYRIIRFEKKLIGITAMDKKTVDFLFS